MTLKKLTIDEKWAVMYDPSSNDRPMHWVSHGTYHESWKGDNAVTSLFYALLDKETTDANT